jgi:hypothetical protein
MGGGLVSAALLSATDAAMSRRIGYGIGSLGAGIGLLAAYYALPLVLAVISVGEICVYSPLRTSLCGDPTGGGPTSPPSVPTIHEVVACREDGIHYVGSTPEGAEVCLTVSPDGKELVEAGFSFVAASGCPNGALGGVHSNATTAVDPSGHVASSIGLTATIRGARAPGVIANSKICRGKKFKWSAQRDP